MLKSKTNVQKFSCLPSLIYNDFVTVNNRSKDIQLDYILRIDKEHSEKHSEKRTTFFEVSRLIPVKVQYVSEIKIKIILEALNQIIPQTSEKV